MMENERRKESESTMASLSTSHTTKNTIPDVVECKTDGGSSQDHRASDNDGKCDGDQADKDSSALEAQPADEQTPVHSAFTKNEKRFIIAMISMASFFSPLSGQIYYPVMPTLVQNYHLTTALVNLTVTTYMILQGLAPSFMGTFADSGGRRPAYILAFVIYTAANIGLAVQDSFAALLVLRCLQSAGSSGTVSFGYGVVSDIATPSERGRFVGPMAAGVMVAPALGPVIGGILAKFLGWRSVFWFLVIISGGYLVVFTITVPETARRIVGNGSVPPKECWRMSLIQYLAERRRVKKMSIEEREEHEAQQLMLRNSASHTRKLKFPNPLDTFVILLEKDALIIISFIGTVMFANIALLTSTPNIFTKIYGFNDLQIGLCFLPLGTSACLAAILNGRLLDWNYCRTATRLGFSIDRKKGDDIRTFPIEKTRLQTFFPLMSVGILTYLPYGWVLQKRAPLVAPLILQFIIGFCFVAALNTLNTLIVDLFPDRSATASAANNLVRCWLGAVGAALIDQMLRGMGGGWCFTFLGLVMAVGLGFVLLEGKYGMEWREQRRVKMEKKKEDRKRKEEEKKQEEQIKGQEGGQGQQQNGTVSDTGNS